MSTTNIHTTPPPHHIYTIKLWQFMRNIVCNTITNKTKNNNLIVLNAVVRCGLVAIIYVCVCVYARMCVTYMPTWRSFGGLADEAKCDVNLLKNIYFCVNAWIFPIKPFGSFTSVYIYKTQRKNIIVKIGWFLITFAYALTLVYSTVFSSKFCKQNVCANESRYVKWKVQSYCMGSSSSWMGFSVDATFPNFPIYFLSLSKYHF